MKQTIKVGGREVELDVLTQNELRSTLEETISGYLRPTMPRRDQDGVIIASANDVTITLPPVPRGMEVIYTRIVLDAPGAYTPANPYVAAGAYASLLRNQELVDFLSLEGSSGVIQTPVQASATGAAAAINAQLPAGGAGVTTYLTGFTVTGSGATAGSVIVVTVSGPNPALSYELVIPAGVGSSITPLQINFSPAIPANLANAAITVQVPSFGAGNTNAAVVATGYQQSGAAAGGEALGSIPHVWTFGTNQAPRFRDGEALACLLHVPPPINTGIILRADGYLSPIAEAEPGSLLVAGAE